MQQNEAPIIYHIRLMLRKATPEQLSIIYLFLRGYLRTPPGETQAETEETQEET